VLPDRVGVDAKLGPLGSSIRIEALREHVRFEASCLLCQTTTKRPLEASIAAEGRSWSPVVYVLIWNSAPSGSPTAE
jgi:hypothetical protein